MDKILKTKGSIGQASYKQLTKKDLIELIEKNFIDNRETGHIAVMLTVYNEKREKHQTITFGKILED
jgi:hypothetical protein